MLRSSHLAALLIALAASAWTLAAASAAERLRYSRDVRPILAAKCFHCHGADGEARQADLRLDDEASATAGREGKPAIVRGEPGESELVRRITSADAGRRMPPADSERQLTPGEIETLQRWIAAGAEYEAHWSFIAPQRPPLPIVPEDTGRLTPPARQPIDRFILARLQQEGRALSPAASRTTLIRRLSLDLTGLPPVPAEIDAFLDDKAPDAYERLVDRLLASPRTGERLALDWLDGARFADSGGYQGDIFRTMWPWRDWVIRAFNRNQSFDQFTIEQLAGDLLPGATREQLVASGFNRNHRINDEDGIILEEYRVEYVVDRTETTSTLWMGLTLGCSRCHDHKYDPISQREFYSFFAFFNSLDESGRGHGNAPPILSLTTPEQDEQLRALTLEQIALETELRGLTEGEADAARKAELAAAIEAVKKRYGAVASGAPVTMIQRELPTPRETFVLTRGAYDKPGDRVERGVPTVLPPLKAAKADRLALARWLVDPAHPLTSRVLANRYWQMLFGTGLVATPEDFGTQGEPPSHPELLDWLAVELRDNPLARSVSEESHSSMAWDVKRLLRLLVTSAAYRQSSAGTEELFRRDPENRLLARGPRFRLPAELLRDQALAAGGLLSDRLGGPSVRPYQPEGLWKDLASADVEYNQSHGADLYRRSMYTFWRRTVPPPAMSALDAPAREICAVRRARTNTPIQALALMNDPTFVEASRAIAERALRESTADSSARLAYMFRLVLSRLPTAEEQAVLGQALAAFQARYAADADAAAKLIAVGESPADAAIPPAELAAYAALAGAILNLDEALTKE